MVHAYEVAYNADQTLSFNLTQYLQLPVPMTAAAAEIRLTVSFPSLTLLKLLRRAY